MQGGVLSIAKEAPKELSLINDASGHIEILRCTHGAFLTVIFLCVRLSSGSSLASIQSLNRDNQNLPMSDW